MTKEQEINLQIQKLYDSFNSSTYTGDDLPKDILETFKKAVFVLPPSEHKMSMETVKRISSKKVKDLTNMDVPSILNTVSACRLCDLYKDFEDGVAKNKQIEDIKLSFNLIVRQITAEVENKRKNLLSLSGIGDGKVRSLVN